MVSASSSAAVGSNNASVQVECVDNTHPSRTMSRLLAKNEPISLGTGYAPALVDSGS